MRTNEDRERELVKRQLARQARTSGHRTTPLWRYFAAAVLIFCAAVVALSGVLGLWSFFAVVAATVAVGVLIFT